MRNLIIVCRAIDIHRGKDGRVYAWRMSDKGKREFTDFELFKKHIKRLKHLDDVVAFSGSAYLLSQANAFIAQQRAMR